MLVGGAHQRCLVWVYYVIARANWSGFQSTENLGGFFDDTSPALDHPGLSNQALHVGSNRTGWHDLGWAKRGIQQSRESSVKNAFIPVVSRAFQDGGRDI